METWTTPLPCRRAGRPSRRKTKEAVCPEINLAPSAISAFIYESPERLKNLLCSATPQPGIIDLVGMN